MKRSVFFVLLLTLVLITTQCAPAPTEPPAPAAPVEEEVAATPAPEEEPVPAPSAETVVIGFTTSQTGKYNVSSTRQVNGLQLWMDHVNDAGVVENESVVAKENIMATAGIDPVAAKAAAPSPL